MVHTKFINEFFYYGLLFGEEHKEYKEITIAYLMGFLTHHELDVITHPFIFYRTGCNTDDNQEIILSKKLHKHYEMLLDTAMMNYAYNKRSVEMHPEKVFKVKPFTLKFLEAFYAYLLNKVYLTEISKKTIKRALQCTRLFMRQFPDKNGIKKKLANKIEKVFDNDLVISQYLYPFSTNERDILNLDKQEWMHPVNGEKFYDSYPELYYKAVDSAADKIKQLFEIYQHDQVTTESVDKILENKSYLTGLNAKEDQTIKYIDNNFKNHLLKEY